MKKLNLMLAASALLLGSYANAQETLWEQGFERGLEFFTDSVPADSIMGLQYYIGRDAGNGTWDVTTYKEDHYLELDTVIYLFHGIAPVNNPAQRIDAVTIEQFEGDDAEQIVKQGGTPGDFYMKYVAGPSSYGFNMWGGAPGVTNDYEANVFVRGLPVTDESSYRVSYFMKMGSPVDSCQVDLRLMRGWYNSEKAFTTSGNSGATEWTQVVKIDTTLHIDQSAWQRYTYMTYYINDSVANKAVHQNGYWWVDEWKGTLWRNRDQFPEDTIKMFANNENLDSATNATWGWIVQPDTYFLRFSFQGPNSTYMVDDIHLVHSWIGAAEYCGNMIRVDFGYETNLKTIANSNGIGQIQLPENAYKVTGFDELVGQTFSFDITTAEYHNDGYLYLWADMEAGDSFEYYNDVKVSFFNSLLPADLQLKYTSSTKYPKALDTEWAKTKIVPDFEEEAVLPRSFSAVNVFYLPPSVKDSNPDEGSFNLDLAKTNKVIVNFSKEVYAKGTDGVVLYLQGSEFESAKLMTTTGYTDDTYKNVEFAFPADVKSLKGDYTFTVRNAKALDVFALEEGIITTLEGATAAENFDIHVSFGPADKTAEGTSAKKNYDLLKAAYDAAMEQQAYGEIDETVYGGTAFNEFKAIVAANEPDAFFVSHTSPKEFAAAADALKAATETIKARFANVDAFVNIKSTIETLFASFAENYSEEPTYKALQSVYNQYQGINVPNTSNEDLATIVAAMKDAYNKANNVIQTVEITTRQIKSLAQLNSELGVTLDANTATELANCKEDNQKLAKILKLNATKALYGKLANGPIDTLDVTGFITNPTLYFTGVLGKEIKQEWYQYASCNRYVLNNGVEFTTVFPGWTIISSTGSVACGYGDTREPADADPDHGGYVEEGFASEGHIGADWSSNFNLKQTATELPNGVFTLTVNFGGGESNKANQYLTANGDTVAADGGQYETLVALEGVKVTDQTMAIEMNHKGCNAWSRADNFGLKLTGALEGFDYAAAIADIEKQIAEATDGVQALEATDDVEYYNLNGVRLSAPEKGVMIRVNNGVAEKVLY